MNKFQRILFPSDFSELSTHALDYAKSLAETYNAELHVIHVVDEAYQYWMALGPNSLPVGPSPEEMLAASTQEIEKFVQEHLGGTTLQVRSKVLAGRPFMEIIRYARENQIDLIVLGTHGRGGLKHVLLGSVTERVVRKSPCPVLTIRHPSHDFVMP
jgi:nucleotide-binding universal stress UspA family protein